MWRRFTTACGHAIIDLSRRGKRNGKDTPMFVLYETSFDEFEPWADAVDTFNRICDEGKADEFEDLIEELYPNGIDETALNDILRFESDWVYESLDITDEDEDEE